MSLPSHHFSEKQYSPPPPEALETKESAPLSVSHEEARIFLKERGLSETQENRVALEEYVRSPEYKGSKRHQAAVAFEDDLASSPLEVRAPHERGGTEEISPAAARFTELVIREKAYHGAPEKMRSFLRNARKIAVAGKFPEDPSRNMKERIEKAEDVSRDTARERAEETFVDWARRMEIRPFGENPIQESILYREACFALRAEGKELSPETVLLKVREDLKYRIDALSFWRGYVREESDTALRILDLELEKFGFEVDGFGAYYDSKDPREFKAGGDLDNFLDGEHLAQVLKQEKEGEVRAVEERESGERARLELKATMHQEERDALTEAEGQLVLLEQRRTVLLEELEAIQPETRGFKGMVATLLIDRAVQEKIASLKDTLRKVAGDVVEKSQEIAALKKKLGVK